MASSTSLSCPLPLFTPSPRATAYSLLNPTALPFTLCFSATRRPTLSLRHPPPPLSVRCARDSRGERTDPIYRNRLVNLFVNRILKNGKKSLAYFIIYRALKRVQLKTGLNPLLVLRQAVREVTPDVVVKARRVGGSTYQVPVELGVVKGRALAIRWLLKAARERQGSEMTFKLSCELMDAAKGVGKAVQTKESIHETAEKNRAFVHIR